MRIRSDVKNNFTWVHNVFIHDKRLTIAERGLLLLLMSLPMNWKFTVTGLASMVADGKDKIGKTLKALETHGYLYRQQQFDEKGSFTDVLYKFSDEPIFLEDEQSLRPKDFMKISGDYDTELQDTAALSTFTEKPCTDSTETENAALINKEINKRRIYKSTKKDILCCEATPRAFADEKQSEQESSFETKKNIKADNTAAYEEIIGYFNKKANSNYRPSTEATQKHIDSWLKQGFTVDDFKTVIDRKCAEWLGTDMAMYLRPSTLFNSKFEEYLATPASGSKKSGHSRDDIPDYSVDMIDLLNEYLES